MNSNKFIVSLVLFIFFVNSFAGDIILYEKPTQTIPKETKEIWDLSVSKKIYVSYQHDAPYTSNSTFRISISKKINSTFIRQESKDFPVQRGATKSVIFFEIKEPGDFIISVIDDKGYITGEQNYTVQ